MMKKFLTFLFISVLLVSCSSGDINDIASYNMDDVANIYLITYGEKTSQEDMKSYVNKAYQKRQVTTYLFAFPKGRDYNELVGITNTDELYKKIVEANPPYSMYRMVNNSNVEDDALFLIKLLVEDKKGK